MKKIILTLIACIMMPLMSMAQEPAFVFRIDYGLSGNPKLKAKIEKQVTNLLNLMDYSQKHNMNGLNFKNISISVDAKRNIEKMWSRKHLCVWQDKEGETNHIKAMCLKYGTDGYQVRNIPMREFPVRGTIDNPYTEVCINFDLTGKIIDFSITMKNIQYEGIAKNSDPVTNQRNFMMIQGYMNDLKNAYCERDSNYFEKIFSENALIITGVKRLKTVKTDVRVTSKTEYDYIVKTKKQYLAALKKIFAKNKNDGDLVVNFTNINVKKSLAGDYYIVYAEQEWDGKNYGDLGNITVLWDCRNPDEPQILVRVWQELTDLKKYGFNDFPLE